jgi:hypothetical protein
MNLGFLSISPLLIVILQLITVVHAVKTGRTSPWVYLIIFVPLIGSIAYLLVEILPDPQVASFFEPLTSIFDRIVNPAPSIDRLEKELEFNNAFGNRIALAQAYERKGNITKALELYEGSLNGFYENDVPTLEKVGMLYFQKDDYKKALHIFEHIDEVEQQEPTALVLLMIARCKEKLGNKKHTRENYERAVRKASGLEADYYYAAFLQKNNENELMKEHIKQTQRKFDGMYSKFKRQERVWMNKLQKL